MQANAQRAERKSWLNKFLAGKDGNVGYAPVLFWTVVVNIILFINSVLFGG